MATTEVIMEWIKNTDGWLLATSLYVVVALLSFVPVLQAILKKVDLHPNGKSFDESTYFSDSQKTLLNQHYSRIQGTLLYWKNAAEKYRRFHFYCLIWTIPISILIPILTQAVSEKNASRLFLTVLSSHAAVLFGTHKALKVENNFKGFRHGESEFYDLYRRFLDMPQKFGGTSEAQLASYFEQAEQLRRYVRNTETDNFPTIEAVAAEVKKRNC